MKWKYMYSSAGLLFLMMFFVLWYTNWYVNGNFVAMPFLNPRTVKVCQETIAARISCCLSWIIIIMIIEVCFCGEIIQRLISQKSRESGFKCLLRLIDNFCLNVALFITHTEISYPETNFAVNWMFCKYAYYISNKNTVNKLLYFALIEK